MSKSAKKSRIQIEDLPIPEQELTSEMAQAVIGGYPTRSRLPTAYGTHDYMTRSSHWDYDQVEVDENPPEHRPRGSWA